MQAEQNELNRVKDFDLDAWLDEVEPTHRVQTVNTRGDLLAIFGKLKESRDTEIRALQHLAAQLPDDGDDAGVTLSDESGQEGREKFEAAKTRLAQIDAKMAEVTAEYARNTATFTFAVIDKSERARINAEHQDHKGQKKDQTLRLMLASVVSITVVRDGAEHPQDLKSWNETRFGRFLDRVGDGQARLLLEAYLGLAVGDVTPPFSRESSPGGDTSTY